VKRPNLRHRIVYGIARGGIFCLTLLPERVAYTAMGGVARLFLLIVRSRMRLGLDNARLALGADVGERELRRIVRLATANAFQNVLDMVWAIRLLRRGRLEERFDTSVIDRFDLEPPFIGCTGHGGGWEMAALMIASVHGECHAIGRTPKNPLIADFLRRQREAMGLVLHPRRGGIRPVARALARGKVALQVVDQNQRLRGVFVPWFGRLASTERSAAALAVRRGYPVLVGMGVRLDGRFRFRLDLLPPFRAETTDDPEQDVLTAATRINAGLETLVRRHPEQYLWVHDRYRTRPPSDDAPTRPAPVGDLEAP
jgi:lauroyl/myristoyl acyltransferase